MIDIDALIDEFEADVALAHLANLVKLCENVHQARLLRGEVLLRGASAAHHAETGHPLTFGCCRLENGSQAA